MLECNCNSQSGLHFMLTRLVSPKKLFKNRLRLEVDSKTQAVAK